MGAENPYKQSDLEPIGKRIARLRSARGWTQQNLASRLAISRVAVSHFEMEISLPGERTVALLAGLFKIPPHELVAGTTYPQAKADRLPETVCSHTDLELALALLENDLAWLGDLQDSPGYEAQLARVRQRWGPRLARYARECLDPAERDLIQTAQGRLENLSP